MISRTSNHWGEVRANIPPPAQFDRRYVQRWYAMKSIGEELWRFVEKVLVCYRKITDSQVRSRLGMWVLGGRMGFNSSTESSQAGRACIARIVSPWKRFLEPAIKLYLVLVLVPVPAEYFVNDMICEEKILLCRRLGNLMVALESERKERINERMNMLLNVEWTDKVVEHWMNTEHWMDTEKVFRTGNEKMWGRGLSADTS